MAVGGLIVIGVGSTLSVFSTVDLDAGDGVSLLRYVVVIQNINKPPRTVVITPTSIRLRGD